ncbi:MAG TPA: penicillin-binding protein 1C, partial [Myxococcota bacterium]|nr:penicillin-binding protein 1C [Myxococcota bacterium]
MARPLSRYLSGMVVAALVLVAGVGLGAVNYGLAVVRDLRASLPPTPDLATMPVSTAVADRDGNLLRPFTTRDGRWRLPVTLDEVDPHFIEMLVAYEDERFREHGGIDWRSMARAATQFAGAGGRIVSGGSTLTMQVARLIEGAPTRNMMGKLRQMVHSDLIEQQLSKDEILTLYLTLAPYGGNIEGVRAASLAWFGKEPARLTTAEAALLVALPQSPEGRRPDRDVAAALEARNKVLDRMVSEGVLSAEEAEVARREPMPKARRDFPMLAPHLAQVAAAAQPNARRIELTVDRELQAALEKLGAQRAAQLGSKISVAIVAADLASGEVLASVGSAGLFATEANGFVDMTRAVRSPGSTLKPLIYGLAFELGLAHPESLIEDRPTAFRSYVPVNFDRFSRGTVTIRRALIESLNVPAVIVLDAVGTARLIARIKRANANPLLPDNTAPSLAVGLGGVGVTLRDLVSIYASIARGGSPVLLRDGAMRDAPRMGEAAPVLDRIAAWYVGDILRDVAPPANASPGRVAY